MSEGGKLYALAHPSLQWCDQFRASAVDTPFQEGEERETHNTARSIAALKFKPGICSKGPFLWGKGVMKY